jgi:triacylglycerol esterase/lipase EstA (alpha/beta hydrolase family)
MAAIATVAPAVSAAAPAAPRTRPVAAPLPIGTLADGLLADLTAWWTPPPGADNWSCRPTAAHPYPVILLHGTFGSSAVSWQALSPMLANAGYCVFALDYGQTVPGPFYGTVSVVASASALKSFVQKVLRATGARQVDIVGHSQGGLMPRWYIDFMGGRRLVHMLVGLAPSNHGTTALGFATLITDLELLGLPSLADIGCTACDEQLAGSAFLQRLNAGGDTVAGPRYVVIETAFDEIVTPYKSAFLSGPNVQNILLQDQCSDDFTDHLGILYDPNALADVMNVLGPDSPTFQPPCVPSFPVVG